MQRPQLKADLAENVLRTHDALWRRARVTHSALVDTTWANLVRACGFPADMPVENARRSVRRYLELLAEAGLIAWGGATSPTGQWKCLHVELLEPPAMLPGPAGVAQSVPATAYVCQARRLREHRREREQRRRQPWRRSGGRRDARPRHALSWSSDVPTPSSENASPFGGGRSFPDGCARARGEDASDAALSRAQAPRSGGEDGGERERRRQARRQRRREQRVTRWQAETARELRDGDRLPLAELERQRRADADPGQAAADYGRFAAFLASIPSSS